MYYVIIIWGFLIPLPCPLGLLSVLNVIKNCHFLNMYPQKFKSSWIHYLLSFFGQSSCHFNPILILSSSLTRDVSFYCLRSVNINVSGYMFSYLASRHANYPLFFSNVFFCIHPHQKMYACIDNQIPFRIRNTKYYFGHKAPRYLLLPFW